MTTRDADSELVEAMADEYGRAGAAGAPRLERMRAALAVVREREVAPLREALQLAVRRYVADAGDEAALLRAIDRILAPPAGSPAKGETP